MDDIALLFASDPLGHTNEDISRMVAKVREARVHFNSTGKAPALGKQAKPAAAPKLDLGIDLGDLFGKGGA